MIIYGVIPARSGSKGVAHKNIRDLSGHPMLAYSIAASKMCKKIDSCLVTTDSVVYKQIAYEYGANYVVDRPKLLAGDKSRDIDYLLHLVYSLDMEREDIIVLLRPTTPLRDPVEIDKAIDIAMKSPCDSLRSFHWLEEPPEKMFRRNSDGTLRSCIGNPIEETNLPRKLFEPACVPNGYVDVVKVSTLLDNKTEYGKTIAGFETCRVPEIDCEEDFKYAEFVLSRDGSELLGYLGKIDREILDIPYVIKSLEPKSMQTTYPIVWKKAINDIVEDTEGKRYIDLTSTIFVMNVGHSNKRVKEYLKRQINSDLLHTYGYLHESRALFLKKLMDVTPGFCEKAFLLSSGTETTEAAVKLMRANGPKRGRGKKILSIKGSMHGRTMAAELLKGSGLYDHQDFVTVPYPDKNSSFLFEGDISELCGVMIETYQGWSARFLPDAYMDGLLRFIKDNSLLLCFDEIQSGLGRTGKLFGYEYYNASPDLICIGKGLGGGLPLSAVLGRAELLDTFDVGDMSSTHSANPVCCAAGLAVLEELIDGGLVHKAYDDGIVLNQRLMDIRDRFSDKVVEINSRGLVAAVITPTVEMSDKIYEKCLSKGVLLVHTGKPSIKIGPPLTITADNLNKALDTLGETIRDL